MDRQSHDLPSHTACQQQGSNHSVGLHRTVNHQRGTSDQPSLPLSSCTPGLLLPHPPPPFPLPNVSTSAWVPTGPSPLTGFCLEGTPHPVMAPFSPSPPQPTPITVASWSSGTTLIFPPRSSNKPLLSQEECSIDFNSPVFSLRSIPEPQPQQTTP